MSDELEALRQRVRELENELDRWKRHATIAVEQTLALRASYAAANARADAADVLLREVLYAFRYNLSSDMVERIRAHLDTTAALNKAQP